MCRSLASFCTKSNVVPHAIYGTHTYSNICRYRIQHSYAQVPSDSILISGLNDPSLVRRAGGRCNGIQSVLWLAAEQFCISAAKFAKPAESNCRCWQVLVGVGGSECWATLDINISHLVSPTTTTTITIRVLYKNGSKNRPLLTLR